MSWRTGTNTGFKGPATLSRQCPSCKKWKRGWTILALVRHIVERHMAKAA